MKKLRLLLVDDETEFVDTLADRMKMRDLEADIARNGEEALSAVKKEEPDVIVLDVKMPGMDGIEVLKRVKDAYPDEVEFHKTNPEHWAGVYVVPDNLIFFPVTH